MPNVSIPEHKDPFSTSGPIFPYESGSPLTRENLIRETRLLLSKGRLKSSAFASHSFRIHAATTASSANLPPLLIIVLGRWSSDCFERYIKTLPSVLAQVSETKQKRNSCGSYIFLLLLVFRGSSMGECFAFCGAEVLLFPP